MHQRLGGAVVEKRLINLRCRDGRSEWHEPARQRLAQGDDIGRDARRLHREQRARAPEADENLIEDDEYACRAREIGDAIERRRIVHLHAARALHQRLNQHGGKMLPCCASAAS